MASKVEILGGQLDGSVLSNAASESTLRELVDAVKKLEAASIKNTRAGVGSGGSATVDVDTDPANKSLNSLSSGVNKAGKAITSSLGTVSKGIASAAFGMSKSLLNMAGLMTSGQNNLSSFVGALGLLPGPLGKLASTVASGISVLERFQDEQRKAAMVGASFNNSMMEMRIAAAQAGMALEEYGNFIRANAQNIGGLGDTITEGAKKLSQVGEAVGKSGLDVEFMKLGYSSVGARQAAMRFSTELVKSDRVRGASARSLAEASLSYEKDLDLLAKQTGKSKDELRAFSEGLIKRGGALQFAFGRMAPEVQAALKSVMNTVGNTMGEGAQTALVDLLSGAVAPSSEASAMFQAQMPGVVQAFKEMKEVANDTSLSDAERKAKTDSLMARAQAEQLQFLQSEQGRFLMENKTRLSPAQRSFIEGLEANAKALSEQGIDITNATQADIERVTAAKRAEQERQAALDKGFNEFQAVITRISSAIQTTFFTILSPILEKLAGGITRILDGFGSVENKLADMGIAFETISPVINFIADMLGTVLGGAFEAVAFVTSKIFDGFQSLMQPIRDLFAAFGFLGADSNTLIDGFKSLIDIVNTVFVVIKDVLGGGFDFLFSMIRMMIGAITDIVNVFKSLFEPQITWVSTRLKEFGEYILNMGPEILKGIRSIFSAEGAQALADGAKSMLQSATGTLLSGIASIIPNWAGGKKLEETAKSMLAASEESKKSQEQNKKAADAQAETRTAAVQQEIDSKKLQTAQLAANAKQNLESGKRELAARRERERQEAESAEQRKRTEKDKQIADAMERSRQAAIKRMQELAGITPPSGATGTSPGTQPPVGATGMPSGPMPQVPADMKSYLAATALVESGGDPLAKASTSSAGGMFQFLDSTWQQMVKEMGKNYTLQDKFDPAKATEVMAYFTQKQKGQLEKGIGREASSTDLYMAHFLGAGGATKFLNAMKTNPNMSAAAMDPAAAKANKSIYYDQSGRERSLQEVYNLMGSKIGKAEQAVASNKWGGKELPAAVAALKKDISPEQLAKMQTQPLTTQVATAGPRPTTPGGTAPTGTTVVASAMPQTQTAEQRAAAEKAAAEKAAAEGKPKPEYTPPPSQVDVNTVLANLNTSIETLVQLQARAVQIADQQLRATKGLSRDAYTAI